MLGLVFGSMASCQALGVMGWISVPPCPSAQAQGNPEGLGKARSGVAGMAVIVIAISVRYLMPLLHSVHL